MSAQPVETQTHEELTLTQTETVARGPDLCGICTEPINPDDPLTQGPRCGHVFHPACLDMAAKEMHLDADQCPTCYENTVFLKGVAQVHPKLEEESAAETDPQGGLGSPRQDAVAQEGLGLPRQCADLGAPRQDEVVVDAVAANAGDEQQEAREAVGFGKPKQEGAAQESQQAAASAPPSSSVDGLVVLGETQLAIVEKGRCAFCGLEKDVNLLKQTSKKDGTQKFKCKVCNKIDTVSA